MLFIPATKPQMTPKEQLTSKDHHINVISYEQRKKQHQRTKKCQQLKNDCISWSRKHYFLVCLLLHVVMYLMFCAMFRILEGHLGKISYDWD